MEVTYTLNAQKDIEYWKKSNLVNIKSKIEQLIKAIQTDPYRGIGKPEPLKHNLTGMWSRRINREHRIIYEVVNDKIVIHALKEHY